MCAIRNLENSRRVSQGLTGWQRPPSTPKLHVTMAAAHPDMESCAGQGMGMRAGTGTPALGDPTAQPKRQSASLHLLPQAQHEAGTWQGSDHLRRIDVLGQSF